MSVGQHVSGDDLAVHSVGNEFTDEPRGGRASPVLREHHYRQRTVERALRPRRAASGYVFTDPHGRPLHPG
jgi:hypothetical protein